MKNKVAAIGFCCIDVYKNLNKFYPTGNGIDCIINLSKKGIKVSAISVVGNDDYGEKMLDTLKDYNVDISHMQLRDGETSVFIMDLLENNDRVHVKNIPGVMENYIPTVEDINFAKNHEYIHTDLFGKVVHLIPELKENNSKLIFDFSVYANDENMESLLPYIDYAFFSVGEGNHDKAIELLKRAKRYGGSVMTATLGEDGSICYDGDRFYEGASVKTNVINTVGAGDSFIAGFMYGVISNKTIDECLKEGATLAAEIVGKFNPY